ncbi:MAG: hypothetical protein CM15mP6_3390 [Methanobacteriota archaeon]|nr:MAG: hypothetical protein CM15mP6_3390 [Euryarchaeota archaeon]
MGSFLLVGGSSDIGILLTKKLVEGGNKVTLLVRDESRVSDLPEEMVERFVGDANERGAGTGSGPILHNVRRWDD